MPQCALERARPFHSADRRRAPLAITPREAFERRTGRVTGGQPRGAAMAGWGQPLEPPGHRLLLLHATRPGEVRCASAGHRWSPRPGGATAAPRRAIRGQSVRRAVSRRHPCRPPFRARRVLPLNSLYGGNSIAAWHRPTSTAKLRFDGNTRAHRRPADRRRKPGPRPAQHPERAGRRNARGRRPPRLRRRRRLGGVRRDAQSRRSRAAASGGHAATRTPLAGLRARARDARLPLRAVSRDRDGPEPAARRHRPAAGATRPTRLAHGELVRIDDAYEWRWADDDLARPLWPVIHEALTAPDGRPARSREGLRAMPVPLPRPEQEPQPAVVLDGRLRHRRQDGEVRGTPGVRPLGDRPVLAQQLEPVEVDAAVADGRIEIVCAPDAPHVARKTTRRNRVFAASRSTVPRSTPSTVTVARP